MLSSFGNGIHSVICGSSGGIGRAFVTALCDDPAVAQVLGLSRSAPPIAHDKLIPLAVDLQDEATIAAAAGRAGELGAPRLVVVTTGILHDGGRLRPEKTWKSLDAENLARSFAVNATGPALVAKHFLPLLPKRGKAVFAALSARVGSIDDNRLGGWYAYRASKAALNMLIKTLAIELRRTHREAVCAGLHPGTVDTRLSQPFQAGVPDGKLFSPAFSAARLLSVIDGLTPQDSGHVFAWDGQQVPP